jgi:hypothetical protein
MWETEALRDWDRLRATIREDVAGAARRPRPATWLRLGVWLALLAAWTLVGWPFLAIPAVAAFELFVAPGLRRPRPRELGRLRPWQPPESFVVSPESLPADRADQ